MKRSLLIAVLLLAVPAATAAAKGPIESIDVCGGDGCATVEEALLDGAGPDGFGLLYGSSGEPTSAPPTGPFYRMVVHMPGGAQFTGFYTSRSGLISQNDQWWRPDPRLAAALAAAARELEPFHGAHLRSVFVNGRRSDDPGGYEPLLGRLEPAAALASQAYAHSSEWVSIDLTPATPSPWLSGGSVFYDPELDAVSIAGGRWMRAPYGLGDRIRRDAGLPTGGGAATLPRVLGGAALSAVAAAAAFALLRRSRSAPRPAGVA